MKKNYPPTNKKPSLTKERVMGTILSHPLLLLGVFSFILFLLNKGGLPYYVSYLKQIHIDTT